MPLMQMPVIPKVLSRPRLEKLMETVLDKRFTLVSGSPGQGKTTLVVDVLQRLPYDVFWYSLDANNTKTSKFIRDLLIFLKALAIIPEADASPLCLASVEETCLALADFLSKISFDNGLFIVLDDFHVVEESGDFDIFIKSLMSIAPPSFHFIIISRTEPHWKLAQKTVQREMLKIGNSQLAFSPGETKEFFREIYDLNLSDAHLSRIKRLTEGWVASMVLVGDKLTIEPSFLETYSMDSSGLANKIPELGFYLEQEIYNNLSSAQQNVLLATSIMDEIPYDLANYLCSEQATTDLEDLISKNVLVYSTNQEHKTYRYHALWKSFLILKATDIWGKNSMWKLHRQAGAYFLEQKNWKEAFRHYVEGQDVNLAIEVIKKAGPEILDFHLTEKLHSLVNSIPLGKMEEDAWIQFAYACSVRFRDPALCYHYLQRALEGFRSIKDAKGELQVLCLNTEVLMFFPGDLHLMQHLLADNTPIPPHAQKLSDLRVNGYRDMYAALSHSYLTGNLNEAVRLGEQARRTSFVLQDNNLKLWSCWALALASTFIGNFAVAQKRLAEALQIIDSPGVDEIVSVFIPYMAGLTADFMGEFDRAHSFLEEALRKSQKLKMEAMDFYIKNFLSYAEIYRGNIQYSEKQLNDMSDIIGMCSNDENEHLRSYFLAFKAHHVYLRNKSFEAVALGRQALELRQTAGGQVYTVQCHLILGTALKDTGNIEESEHHLLEALKRSTAMSSTFFESSCYIQLALLFDQKGNAKLSADYLNKALRIASEKSYYHFFMWRDDHILRLISLAKNCEHYREYIKKLWTRRFGTNDGIKAADDLWKSTPEENRGKPLKLFMLGPLVVDINGRAYRNMSLRKAIYLLSLIAVKEESVSLDVIIEEMWPEWDFKLARNNFYFTLHRLRELLGNKDLIIFKDGQCRINPDSFWTDIQYFNAIISSVKNLSKANQKQEALELLAKANQLYRGELLAGENLGALLTLEREALSKKYCHCLVTMGKLLLELGRHKEAVSVLTQACSDSFADEYSVRLLMLAHYAMGNQWQALQTYNKLSQYLLSELGSRPHRITTKLHDLIKNGQNPSLLETIKWLSQELSYSNW